MGEGDETDWAECSLNKYLKEVAISMALGYIALFMNDVEVSGEFPKDIKDVIKKYDLRKEDMYSGIK